MSFLPAEIMNNGGRSLLEIQMIDAFDTHWPNKYSVADVIRWEQSLRHYDPDAFVAAIGKWRDGPKGHFPPKLDEIVKLMPPLARPTPPAEKIVKQEVKATEQYQERVKMVDAEIAKLSDDEFQRLAKQAVDKIAEDIRGLYERMLLMGKGREVQSLKLGVYELMQESA